MLDVFVDTPTGNQRGPPSTSFARAEQLHPFWVRLRSARYARLRSASPQRGEAGGKEDKLQKQVYTGQYIGHHADVKFSHGICPKCVETVVKPELERLEKEMSEGSTVK